MEWESGRGVANVSRSCPPGLAGDESRVISEDTGSVPRNQNPLWSKWPLWVAFTSEALKVLLVTGGDTEL